MAKGKYQDWLTSEGLLKLEAWARDNREIRESLKKGKEVIDIQVENALLKRALGYEYTEKTKERIVNPETKVSKMVVTKEVTKEVLPDTTAQIFWLKNRKPDVWRDKKEIGVNGNINTNMTNEQLDAEIERLTTLLEDE
jgi:hypothetical protein